jgi:hypothetical protein
MFEKCYILYADEKYAKTAERCAQSIRRWSDIPIYAYMLNTDIKIEYAECIRWDCELTSDESQRYFEDGDNFYINRLNKSVYSMLIQRPLIVKDALNRFAKKVAYIDSDSIATPNVDNIFNMFNNESEYPFFVEGIYDVLFMNGRGGIYGVDYTKSLEHPACMLFNVDQTKRKTYRQTGYFVSGHNCHNFLEEWYSMCSNTEVLNNCDWYAPFNEETIVNVLLWKYDINEGLPYIYVNIGNTSISEVYSFEYTGVKNHIREWVAIPSKEQELLFFHGQKNERIMLEMIEEIKEQYAKSRS